MSFLNISPSDAYEICANYYSGDSKQVSKCKSGELPLSEAWWLSAKRPENAESERLWSGVHAYIEISAQAYVALSKPYTFYAMFGHSCGNATRPDKGICKALIESGYATFKETGNEYAYFQLTVSGQNIYQAFLSEI